MTFKIHDNQYGWPHLSYSWDFCILLMQQFFLANKEVNIICC